MSLLAFVSPDAKVAGSEAILAIRELFRNLKRLMDRDAENRIGGMKIRGDARGDDLFRLAAKAPCSCRRKRIHFWTLCHPHYM